MSAVERTAELSDEVLSVTRGGAAGGNRGVTKFVDTVDQTLLPRRAPSRRQEIVDAAMEIADRLVHTQYDFLRKVVQSAGKTLADQPDDKK